MQSSAIHGFQATISRAEVNIDVTFDGPFQIVDQRNSVVEAYRLVVREPGATIEFYANETFHLIRRDTRCTSGGEYCDEVHNRWWNTAGTALPFGVGLMHQLRTTGGISTWISGEEVGVHSKLTTSGETAKLIIEDIPPGWPSSSGGLMFYEQGVLLPRKGPGFEVVSYDHGGLLQPITNEKPALFPASIAIVPGRIYPGSGVDWLERGFPDDEFHQVIMESEQGELLLDGCYHRFRLEVQPREERQLLGPVVRTYKAEAWLQDKNQDLTKLEVEVDWDGRDATGTVVAAKTAGDSVQSCQGIQERPPQVGPMALLQVRPSPGLVDALDVRWHSSLAELRSGGAQSTGTATFLAIPEYVRNWSTDESGVRAYEPFFTTISMADGQLLARVDGT